MKPGRGRPRKANTPKHIDSSKVPRGVFWDANRARWYTKTNGSTKRLGGVDLLLSDLQRIAEEQDGIDRASLRFMSEEFARSASHAKLSESTKKDYAYCHGVILGFTLRDGSKFCDLKVVRITRPLIQRFVDSLAKSGPSKAAHVRRYLSRLWKWGANHGHAPAINPATGIDMPTERKRRRLPEPLVLAAVLESAYNRGQLPRNVKGSCAEYIWAVADLAYLCRLRGIEVVTLRESAGLANGIMTNRRKGSRDNVVMWSPRLRAAWDFLIDRRDKIWSTRKVSVPARAEDRPLVVSEDGSALAKPSLDSAWQRFMQAIIEAGEIAPEHRFSLHDLKRRGITDTSGTRGEKQQASGHRAESMLDVYDLSVPVVSPSGVVIGK